MRGAFLVAVIGAGCGQTSHERACDPVDSASCGTGRACYVDADGEPACRVGTAGKAAGSACAAPADCAAGSGCVAVLGIARCAPFCDPASAAGAATCFGAYGRGGASARCLAAVPDRTDIGLCVVACADPSDPSAGSPPGCPPGGRACAIPAGVDVAVCTAVVGDGVEGGRCDPVAACGPALMCVPRGDGGVCRRVVPEAASCGDVPAHADPRSAFYKSCGPCAVVAGALAGDPAGTVYEACAPSGDFAAAAARCEAESGALADPGPDAARAAALADLVALVAPRGTFWLAGTAPDCRTLNAATGSAGAATCDGAAQALCVIAR